MAESAPPTLTFCGSSSSTSLHFSKPYDIMLIKEVIAVGINPAKGKSSLEQWEQVVQHLNEQLVKLHKHVGVRQSKERGMSLLKAYKKQCAESKKASGVDEDHDELDDLLQDWIDLIDELNAEKKAKIKATEDLDKKGIIIRDLAMKNLAMKNKKQDDTDSESENQVQDGEKPVTPKSVKKRKGSDIVEYLREKNAKDTKLKEEELKIRKVEADNMKMMLQYMMKKNE